VEVFSKYKEFSDISFNVCDATSRNCIMTAYLLSYILKYLLTRWSRVLLQPVKKFPAFYRTRRFITSFTSARHQSLSWGTSIQSILPQPVVLKDSLYFTEPLHRHSAWCCHCFTAFNHTVHVNTKIVFQICIPNLLHIFCDGGWQIGYKRHIAWFMAIALGCSNMVLLKMVQMDWEAYEWTNDLKC